MTYMDEYRAALDQQLAALDAHMTGERPTTPCPVHGDPRVCDCNPTPDDPAPVSGWTSDQLAGRNYPGGP